MSYLRFASKVRPEVSMGGCVDLVTTGSNLAMSADAYQAAHGIEIPHMLDESISTPGYYSSGTVSPAWYVDDSNPRSGTWHFRGTVGAHDGRTYWETLPLVPVHVARCGLTWDDWGQSRFSSANVAPGMDVDISFWMMASATSPNVTVAPIFEFYDAEVNLVATEQPGVGGALGAIQTSYTEYTFHYVVPAGADYMLVRLRCDATEPGLSSGVHVDIDDISIVVS